MYGGINNPNAMRMLQSLYSAHSAPAAAAPAPKAPARRKAAPPPSPSVSSETSDSDSYDSDSSSSYSSYEETDVIYKKVVQEAACPYVSPAGLRDQKTKKDAIKHLKAKGCPEVPKLKKSKGGPLAPAKRDTKKKVEEAAPVAAPVQAVEQTPKPEIKLTPEAEEVVKTATKKRVAKKKVTVVEHVVPAPAAPAPAPAAEGKKKRAPNAYNTFVAEKRKAGLTMAQAAAAWKAAKGDK